MTDHETGRIEGLLESTQRALTQLDALKATLRAKHNESTSLDACDYAELYGAARYAVEYCAARLAALTVRMDGEEMMPVEDGNVARPSNADNAEAIERAR